MIVKINESLKLIDYQIKLNSHTVLFIRKNVDKDCNHVRNNIEGENYIFHKNYLQYLELCWSSHYGVVLNPDIIWYTLLSEVCGIISEKPKAYQSLFTDSDDKKEISVFSDDLEVLPLNAIMNELKQLIPNGFANDFLPTFSTSTTRSKFAQYAALADTVSPYYNYSMYMCGISSVRLDGTSEDWQKISDGWKAITSKLVQLDSLNESYYNKVVDILQEIPKGNAEFYKNMFYAEKCGSGSETEVYGWFTDLMRIQPDKLRKADNFASHISLVRYKHLDTGKKYVMKNGVFYSQIIGRELVPDFGFIVYEDVS